MRILVTGGAGFIGSHIVDAYLEAGHDVAVVDSLWSHGGGRRENVPAAVRFYQVDVRDLELREVIRKEQPEVINHHAAQHSVKLSTDDPAYDAQVNVLGLINMLTGAQQAGVRKVIFPSSAATYGAASEASVETNGAAPANVYAFSKAMMDNLANRAAAEEKNWIIIGLRYFNVYGPREAHKGTPASMVFHLSRQMKAGQRPRIFKHGDQKRDFVYVKDIVEGSIRALDAKESGIYNLGSGHARSFNELVDVLNRSLGTDFKPDYIENPHAHYQNFTQADLTSVRTNLGYEPQYSWRR